MDRRYELFADGWRAQHRRLQREGRPKPARELPYIVIVIDELADLMMVARARSRS